MRVVTATVEAYADVSIGLNDASLVVLASVYGTDRIATPDRRHSSVRRLPRGGPVRILPL